MDDYTPILTPEERTARRAQRAAARRRKQRLRRRRMLLRALPAGALGLVLVGAGAGPTLLLTAAWLCSNLLREADFEGKRKPLRRRKRRRGEAA